MTAWRKRATNINHDPVRGHGYSHSHTHVMTNQRCSFIGRTASALARYTCLHMYNHVPLPTLHALHHTTTSFASRSLFPMKSGYYPNESGYIFPSLLTTVWYGAREGNGIEGKGSFEIRNGFHCANIDFCVDYVAYVASYLSIIAS
jgi:hypothetical protein